MKSMMTWVVAAGAGWLLGCGNGSNSQGLRVADAGTDSGDSGDGGATDAAPEGPGGDVVCAGLSEDECISNKINGCEPLPGVMSGMEMAEADQRRYAGCRTSGTGDRYVPCSTATTCGLNLENGECWMFHSTCVPDGWVSHFDETRFSQACVNLRATCPSSCPKCGQ